MKTVILLEIIIITDIKHVLVCSAEVIRYSLFLGNAGCLQNTLLLKQISALFPRSSSAGGGSSICPLLSVSKSILSHGIS